jgi:hypothetical protein
LNYEFKALEKTITIKQTELINEKGIVLFFNPDNSPRFKSSYEYPVEDFCLFKDIPHEKLVFPILNAQVTQCSCQMWWLIKNADFYRKNLELEVKETKFFHIYSL